MEPGTISTVFKLSSNSSAKFSLMERPLKLTTLSNKQTKNNITIRACLPRCQAHGVMSINKRVLPDEHMDNA